MPRTLTQDERDQFLTEPRVGVLSVASDDDRPPLTVPVWYAYEAGGLIKFFTGTQGRIARKARLLEKAGKFSLCVQQPAYPYKYVTVECTLVRADRAPTAEQAFAIVGRYLPEDVARAMAEAETTSQAGTFVLYSARPDRWLSLDFSDDGQQD
jgi:nitroimidazol reductase NimA-like FMN-containing flavoprotein (pyridoxamine 5'-phosphate oxidase superfamily)